MIRKAWFILVLVFPNVCWSQGPQLYSKAQRAYLKDIDDYPLVMNISTTDAPILMQRAEGYLAKNMASFTFISDFAIQAKVRSVYLTLSRIDLNEGRSEVEIYCSPVESRRFNTAGILVAVSSGRNTDLLALAALFAGIAFQQRAEKVKKIKVKSDLRYGIFLGRITLKFGLTGAYFPAAAYDELVRDNMPLEALAAEEVDGFKKVTSTKIKEETDPRFIVDQARHAQARGATHFFLKEKKGRFTRFTFYKKK